MDSTWYGHSPAVITAIEHCAWADVRWAEGLHGAIGRHEHHMMMMSYQRADGSAARYGMQYRRHGGDVLHRRRVRSGDNDCLSV